MMQLYESQRCSSLSVALAQSHKDSQILDSGGRRECRDTITKHPREAKGVSDSSGRV